MSVKPISISQLAGFNLFFYEYAHKILRLTYLFDKYVRARLLCITRVRFLTLARLEPANVDINHSSS